jgi:hypothetical protein
MEWLQILAPSVLVVIGGIVGWIVRSRTEEYRAVREKLRAEQRAIYREILEPYIGIFADLKGEGISKAARKIVSYDYKKTAFDLNWTGSDEVVQAYNKMMQHSYKTEEAEEKDPKEMMRLWGNLLLEIRKSLGNSRTKLDEWDMLRGMIKDIDKVVK